MIDGHGLDDEPGAATECFRLPHALGAEVAPDDPRSLDVAGDADAADFGVVDPLNEVRRLGLAI